MAHSERYSSILSADTGLVTSLQCCVGFNFCLQAAFMVWRFSEDDQSLSKARESRGFSLDTAASALNERVQAE